MEKSKSIRQIKVPKYTRDWYKVRTIGLTKKECKKYNIENCEGGIGGSEMASILYLTDYGSPAAKLFHQKVGTIDPYLDDKETMFHGRNQEDYIATLWKYWDGSVEGMMENYKNNNIIRRCRKANGYIVNDKYPWLFFSPDRIINKSGGFNMITNEPLNNRGYLELKYPGKYEVNKWKSSTPIHYDIQVMTGMIVLEADYGELAILEDGRKFKVEYYKKDNDLCDRILDISKNFWYNRILPARKYYKQLKKCEKKYDYKKAEEYEKKITELEPPPDETEAYKEFISDSFLKEYDTIQGNDEMYFIAQKNELLKVIINELKKKRNKTSNQIAKVFRDNRVDEIDFDELGYIRYRKSKSSSKNYTVYFNMQDKPSEMKINKINKEINKLI